MDIKCVEYTAINILQKYNFSKEDAEAFLETFKEAKSDDLATKADILRLEKEIAEIKKNTQIEFAEIKKDIRILEVKIESTKNQLIIWLTGIIFASTGLIIGVLKLS
ncbi:MAG: hypothetical protein SFY32_16540 [Bacteroidota bacterium]|nr:hypothetical protein [Bacteroidota bacterium]